MATLQELQQALIAADKAGAADDARALAAAILKVKGVTLSSPVAPTPEFEPEDPGIGKTMLIGAGRTFDRIGKGMQQMYYGATGNEAAQAKLKQEADSDDVYYEALRQKRPFATGIGESLPATILAGGGAPTLLGNALRMGLTTAVPTALEYGSVGDRLQKGIITGGTAAAIPVAAAALKAGHTLAQPLYQAGRDKIAGRALNRVAGDDAVDVISRLRSAQPLVPNSFPTAAQVAENGGIAAFERMAKQADPTAYTQRAMEQANARVGALRSIAGDEAKIAAAADARDMATRSLYDQAKSMTMKNTPDLAAVLERLPDDVMAKAQNLAKMAGEPLKIGKDIPEQVAFVGGKTVQVPGGHHGTKTVQLPGLIDEAGTPLTKNIPAQLSEYSGKALHYIKLALDDTIGKAGDSALGATEKRLMTGAKNDFLSLVDSGIPAYGQARMKFAELSRPLNQMEIGQALMNKLQPALSDFGQLGAETKATFANALRNGDKLAADVTGFKGAQLANVMTPDQMGLLNNIGRDLARKANAETLGKDIGSDTFQKLAMANIAEQSGVPRITAGLLELPVVSKVTKLLYEGADEKARKSIADALLDPKKAADLMEGANKGLFSPAINRLIQQSAFKTGGLLGTSFPAATGLLAAD